MLLARLLMGIGTAVMGVVMAYSGWDTWLMLMVFGVGTYSVGWCAGHWTADYRYQRRAATQEEASK